MRSLELVWGLALISASASQPRRPGSAETGGPEAFPAEIHIKGPTRSFDRFFY